MRKFKLPESYLWMIIRVSWHLFIILLYLQPCPSLSPFLCSCVDVLRLPWQMTTNLGAAKTKTSSLTALEARNPKSRCWQARLPQKAPGEAASRPLPGSSHQPLEFMGSSGPHSKLCLSLHSFSLNLVQESSLLIRKPVTGVRAQPNSIRPHLNLTNYLWKDAISKQGLILRFQVDMNFRGYFSTHYNSKIKINHHDQDTGKNGGK